MSDIFSREKTICITGLRRHKLNWNEKAYDKYAEILSAKIIETLIPLIEDGYKNFLCGMANGADLIFASSIVKLKETYNDIILQAIIPFIAQERCYISEDKVLYNKILKECNIVRVLEKEYSNNIYLDRNTYLINNSSKLIAITHDLSLKRSGTTQTINLAQKSNLDIIHINPSDFSVSMINSNVIRLF